MKHRTKILLYTTIAMGGVYFLWLVGIQPVIDRMKTLDGQISAKKRALQVEKSYLERKDDIETKWDRMMEEIESPGRLTQIDQFDLFVRGIMEQTIGSESRIPPITPSNQKEQKGDFLETKVQVKNALFKIEEWIRFLVRLANETDFFKVRSLTMQSQFDRSEKVLAVNMDLSTIEYSPAVVKSRGGRRGGR